MVYAVAPVTSPVEQQARLVVETPLGPDRLAERQAGDLVRAATPPSNEPRAVELTLPKGPSSLLIRLTAGSRPPGQATLVTTIVAGQPVSFTGNDASLSAR